MYLEKNMEKEKIKISSIITVGDLAKKLGVSAAAVVAELMKNGVMATIKIGRAHV